MTFSNTKHTYKTILFEEFDTSDESGKLYAVLMDEDNIDNECNVVTGEMVTAIDKLTVHSFKEFVEKFVPYIYKRTGEDENNYPVFEYKFGRDPVLGSEIKLTDASYFKILLNLYRQKGATGDSNIKFDYEDILQAIMPDKILDEYKKKRFLLKNYAEKFFDAKDKGKDTLKYKRLLKSNFDEIKKLYETDVQGLLPILIADTKRKIDFLGGNSEESGTNQSTTSFIPRTLLLDTDGNLVTKEIEVLPTHTDKGKERNIPEIIRDQLVSDYNKLIKKEEQNDQIRSLIVDTFSPTIQSYGKGWTAQQIECEKKKLSNQKVQYEACYRNIMQSFITTVLPVIKKIIGVYVYFDHATADGYLSDGLVVANCKTSDVLSMPQKLAATMEYFGKTASAENKIWMAMLPRVNDGEPLEVFKDDITVDSDDGFGFDVAEDESNMNDDRVPEKDVEQLLNILGDSHILTFFSYQGSKNNSFDGLKPQYIEKMKNQQFISNLKHPEYASCVYPNFTLMEYRKIKISDGKISYVLDGDEVNLMVPQLIMPPIYIDACYAASGLITGVQQHKYLWNRGFTKEEIDSSLPCVHVNVEDLKERLTVNFNRELCDSWNGNIKKAINDGSFGFVFCSDRREVDNSGKPIKNAYVYCARTLKWGNKSNTYMSVHCTLVANYVYSRLNSYNNNTELLMGEVEEWRLDKENKKNVINLLLVDDEDVFIDEVKKKPIISMRANKTIKDEMELELEEV